MELPILRWIVPKPRKVLYLDGEMPVGAVQERFTRLKSGLGVEISNEQFQMLAADQTDIPNVATPEGHQQLEPLLEGIEFLIIDNLSSLCRTTNDNAAEFWTPIQNWLLDLRRRGTSVLLVHHSGRNGQQRGTSRREDVLDTIMALRRPHDYRVEEGARFEVHVEKGAEFVGEGAQPFEAKLVPTEDGQGVIWETRDVGSEIPHPALDLFRQGLTVWDVAGRLGISKSAAGRLRQNAKHSGLLDAVEGQEEPDEDEEAPTVH